MKLKKESQENIPLNYRIKKTYLNQLEKNACLVDEIDDIEQLLISHRDLQIIRSRLPYKILRGLKRLFFPPKKLV